jgi:hypothetical protein
MNRTLISIALALALGLGGCAETEDGSGGGIGFHPRDWAQPGSPDNHAVALADQGLPNSVEEACSGCHGADYGKPDDDCFACHRTGGSSGHPEGGFTLPADGFHGDMVVAERGTDRCGNCHAWEIAQHLDFDLGGWSQQPCDTCHAGGRSGHPGLSVWFDPASTGFHGAAFKEDLGHCGDCHGVDYGGSWTGVGCDEGCHDPTQVDFHPNGWVGSRTTPGTHGYVILNDSSVLIQNCRGCHGADLQGGWSQQDCQPCHAF